ncbi:hypothetical protein MUK42_04367 [Musa troglodytarum]|uniref:peptidylprolyl isomerase n=1 Tax=Musa troglodytarum TaxID=320322 RepID=A0A9E7KXE7_9LILI|nr:hypothetical protein MUK42_04367 [Musa troglodytarum]
MGTAFHPTLSASPLSSSNPRLPPKPVTPLIPRLTSRRSLLASSAGFLSSAPLLDLPPCAAAPSPAFFEIPGSGGVKALDLREGSGETPIDGDRVSIHYYGRLAAKQGWRFDSTYDHKDEMGDPVPFLFVLGSGKVISGIEAAVKSMKVGGTRRVIIPPSQGYQNTSQEPIPPNVRSLLSSTEVLVSLAPASTCLILKLLVASCAYCSLENVLKKHQHIYSRACIQLLDFELASPSTTTPQGLDDPSGEEEELCRTHLSNKAEAISVSPLINGAFVTVLPSTTGGAPGFPSLGRKGRKKTPNEGRQSNWLPRVTTARDQFHTALAFLLRSTGSDGGRPTTHRTQEKGGHRGLSSPAGGVTKKMS